MRDLAASLLMVGMVLLVAGALLWLLPEQVADLPEHHCVTVPLEDRGMVGCDGSGGGRHG